MFGFLKKKNVLTEEQLKWNKMWSLWAEEKIASPYQELMAYQSEINNGGHSQYFTNTENCGDIEKELSALNQLLPPELRRNLQDAYHAYRILEEKDNEEAEETLEKCDDIFYNNEEQIIHLLEDFSRKIEL